MVQMEKDVIVNRLNNMALHVNTCTYQRCTDCKDIQEIFHKIAHVLGYYPNPMLERFD